MPCVLLAFSIGSINTIALIAWHSKGKPQAGDRRLQTADRRLYLDSGGGRWYSTAPMALLSLKNVSLSYGGHPLLDDVELHIERGDRVCLLGVNGAGKSSMLNVLAGQVQPDDGEVVCSSGMRVAMLPQQVPAGIRGCVEEIVLGGLRDGAADARDAAMTISRLQLDPAADFASLSGGMQRRVLLARALAGAPDLVLLDEPTNHLDVDSIDALETYLTRYCRTFLFVTHDRAFLRRLASRIVELDRGHLYDWRCDYDTFLVRKAEALHAETREWERLDERLDKEEAWRRQGVKARTCRNQGRLKALEALRQERRQRRERTGTAQMSIEAAGRTGHVVLKAEGVTFGYNGHPLIREFSTVLTRGDKVGILGPNGCGKTTLVRLLLENGARGGPAADSGRIIHGTNLQIAYSDQFRAQLDDELSLAENIAKGEEFVTIQGSRRHIVGYLQDFLFSPEAVRRKVKSLSGGEKSRLLLARLFAQPSNVLVLDEPTNDLDLDTLELLEEQIANYRGTVLIISHDRAFLNNTVSNVWVFEKHSPDLPYKWLGDAEGWYVNGYVGGYDDWAARRVLPPVAAEPKKSAQRSRQSDKPKPLSYQQQRELKALLRRIEQLEGEQTQLHERFANADFYRGSSDEIVAAREHDEALSTELAQIYRRWEELER